MSPNDRTEATTPLFARRREPLTTVAAMLLVCAGACGGQGAARRQDAAIASVGAAGGSGGTEPVTTGGAMTDDQDASDTPLDSSEGETSDVTNTTDVDRFGVRRIYATREAGREWFMDRENLLGDGIFKSVVRPTPNGDGTWHINAERPGEPNEGARMDVTTPSGDALWRNIEMTGYVRLTNATSPQEFAWRTTSGTPHTNACDGYAYYGLLTYDGTLGKFLKEVWHPNGYQSGPQQATNPTTPLKDRWVGLKVIRYNINDDSQVRLELWLDDAADGNWRKLVDTIDSGWTVANAFPAGSHCLIPGTTEPKTLNVVMTWPYPLVTFRADNASFDFDKLSVREIDPARPN